MPTVPIVIPSEIAIVLNSIGVPPAARMPSLTLAASARWWKLHGIVSIHVVATPMIGLASASSSKPMPLQLGARTGARGALEEGAGVVLGIQAGHAALQTIG